MPSARISTFLVSTLTLQLAACGLDGYHADLTAVHQGTPGCLDAACHPGFTAAGTVFRNLDGLEPAEDVELVLVDAAGGETRVAVSGPSGLFWAEHALPAGEVTFVVGDQRSLAHEMPGHAECNLCHRPGGLEGSEGTLVGRDVFAPSLVSSSPATGSEAVDPLAEIALIFDEPLEPASVREATVRVLGPDGIHPAALLFVEGSDTVVLQPGEPLVAGAAYTIVAERGVMDLAGNGLEAQVQVALAVASDGTPRVVDSDPVAGEADVDPATTITLWVEPALDTSSLAAGGISLSPGCDQSGVDATWSADEQAILVRPLLELPGGSTCGLTVQGLVSVDGVEQDGAWTTTFVTWPDGTAPHALAAVPASGTVAVAPEVVVQLAWSEDLDPDSVAADALQVTSLAGGAVEGSTSLLGQVMQWNATTALPAGETILVNLAAVPSDPAGNVGPAQAPWSFRVGGSSDTAGPTVQGMEPAEGSVDVPADVTLGLRLSEDPDLTTLDAGVSLVHGEQVVPCTLAWDAAEGLLEVQPLVSLQSTTLYELRVGPELLDLSGNPATQRALRFTTTSSGDAGAPIFDGVAAVEGVDTSTILISWNPATDFETPASEILYQVYLAPDSGGQDLDSPTASSEPGATELELGGLEVGITYWVIVRAEDGDGNIDDNQVELSGTPAVGFAEVVHPILIDRCLDCHGSPHVYGDLDMRTYDSLMESPSIDPYNSAGSSLVNYGSHHGSGWFNDEEESLVRAWIDQGALDN
jgi:hypothetical protein